MKMFRNIGVLVITGASAILGMILGIITCKPESITIVKNTKEESK